MTPLVSQTGCLTLYRIYKLKLNVSRKDWDTKVVIRSHYRRIEGQTLQMVWIKKTPLQAKIKYKNKKQTKIQINKQTNNCLQNTTHQERDWTRRTPRWNPGVIIYMILHLMGNLFNNGPTFFILIVRVRINHIII